LVTACHERCEYIGRASACAFTTTERALELGLGITACLSTSNQADITQCSYLLCPRLFRGVTPYRHDGESLSCMQGMACTFRLPAGPCTKEPPDRYRRMCHTPDAFTPGSALRHLSNDKATNGREWGALSCCVYQKGNNLSSKGQYTTTNKSYVVKLVII
jgi:hypothetical protein